MRAIWSLVGLLSLLVAVGLPLAESQRAETSGAEPPAEAESKAAQARRKTFDPQLLELPTAFPTLINPNCSHCVDEQLRRGDQLRRDDRVLAWIRGKYDGGAIPLRFYLNRYPVISDTYGVFVYDHDAGFMRGYEPSLDFRFHGWRNGVMVMRHEDGTLFSTLTGKAFAGPRKGERLTPVATIPSNWGDWVDAYPGTVAYHMFDKYQPVASPEKATAEGIKTRPPIDDRLPAESEVLGIELDGAVRAYPLKVLEKSNGVLVDEVAGRAVVVLWSASTRTAAIYEPVTEVVADSAEESGSEPRRLTLEPLAEGSPVAEVSAGRAPFVDRETGSRWDVAGRAVTGELRGRTLRWLPGVQCRWFAWSAEFPQTEIHGAPVEPRQEAARDAGPAMHAVLTAASDVTDEALRTWSAVGYRDVVVELDERTEGDIHREIARRIGEQGLRLHYWIEVGRNTELATRHPRWMASLGIHDDWRTRHPQSPAPIPGREVAKAFPWVPVGYREAFEAHLLRVERLLRRADQTYTTLLLNDLQGGPAACGCGNLQCRWALDYGVTATAEPLAGESPAVQFVRKVQTLAEGKQVTPVWTAECEPEDLPASRRRGALTTGLCGSVPCAEGRCPKEFASQFLPLAKHAAGPIGLLLLHREFERLGEANGGAAWFPRGVAALDAVCDEQGTSVLPHERLWLVLEGTGAPAEELAAARAAALRTNPGGLIVSLLRIDQGYEPRIIPLQTK